jgi:hypothetical protein
MVFRFFLFGDDARPDRPHDDMHEFPRSSCASGADKFFRPDACHAVDKSASPRAPPNAATPEAQDMRSPPATV